MTDQTIPADLTPEEVEAAREWATSYLAGFYKPGHADAAARALTALLPTPSRPTLADMTPEERAACRRMQADVDGFHEKLVIATPCDDDVALIAADGGIEWMDHDAVTPRPDLPRLTWPGTEKPAPAPAPALPDGWRLADHPQRGRVIVTNTEPDVHGDVWFVRRDPYGGAKGYDVGCCKPAKLTYIDQEGDTSDAVPSNTLAVGSAWDDADALARACRESGRDQIIALDRAGGAYVWVEMAEWWEGSAPPRSAPFTILHTGREADQ